MERDTAGRFRPGNRGRPKGTSKARKLQQALSDDDLFKVVQALIAQALDGNVQAAGLLLSRTIPPLKPVAEPVRFAPAR